MKNILFLGSYKYWSVYEIYYFVKRYKYKGDINSYDLGLTHFMKSKFLNVKEKIDVSN